MTSIEVAAWVQAVGSIIAILAGFGLYFLQQHLSRRDRHAALFSMVVMANTWATGLKDAAEGAETNQDWAHVTSVARRLAKTVRLLIDKIDIGAIISPTVWASITNFIALFDELSVALDEEVRYAETHIPIAPLPGERRSEIIRQCNELLAAASYLQEDLA